MVRSDRGPFRPARPRRARAMHEIFFEKLRNPARSRRAGLMRQFRSGQLDSTDTPMLAADTFDTCPHGQVLLKVTN
jgi:hypothetical protein